MTTELKDPAPIRGVSAAEGSSKAKIERAAVILFAQHGIDGVSTKQIAQQAGLSEGLIYRHFQSKHELALTLMKTIHTRLTLMIQTATQIDMAGETLTDQSFREIIQNIVRQYCEIADNDWPLFRYHILHLHHFPNLSDTPKDNPLEAASEFFAKAVKQKIIAPIDTDILSSMALGVVLNTAQSKVLGFHNGPLSKHIPLLSQSVLNLIPTVKEAQ